MTLELGGATAVGWNFRSPAGGRTTVPSFANESNNYVPVILEIKVDPQALALGVAQSDLQRAESQIGDLRRAAEADQQQIEALTDGVVGRHNRDEYIDRGRGYSVHVAPPNRSGRAFLAPIRCRTRSSDGRVVTSSGIGAPRTS